MFSAFTLHPEDPFDLTTTDLGSQRSWIESPAATAAVDPFLSHELPSGEEVVACIHSVVVLLPMMHYHLL